VQVQSAGDVDDVMRYLSQSERVLTEIFEGTLFLEATGAEFIEPAFADIKSLCPVLEYLEAESTMVADIDSIMI
jgi:hypothetical protein